MHHNTIFAGSLPKMSSHNLENNLDPSTIYSIGSKTLPNWLTSIEENEKTKVRDR